MPAGSGPHLRWIGEGESGSRRAHAEAGHAGASAQDGQLVNQILIFSN